MVAVQKADIPLLSAHELTPAWWTAVLRNVGLDVTVAAAQPEKIGRGQMGQSVRFHLDYANSADGAPTTLVGKFASDDAGSIAAAKTFGSYRREINFYRYLGNRTGMAIPTVRHADFDPDTERFVLIMDDIAPALPADQIEGLSVDQAGLALDEAAKLHASHWSDPVIDSLDWLMGTSGTFGVDQKKFAASWRAFKARFADDIDDVCVDVGEAMAEKYADYAAPFTGPRCLRHNDFRPDNMAFASNAGGRPIVIYDWQTAAVGAGMYDVAYFMGGAMPSEIRKANEDALIRRYHDALTGLGVQGYSYDEAWEHYRRYSLSAFGMAVMMAMMAERTERGDAMFLTVLHRSAQFAKDVDGVGAL